MKTKTLELNKTQVKDLADFIAWDLFHMIRVDTEIDNIDWLCNMCDLYRTLTGMVDQFNREGVEE